MLLRKKEKTNTQIESSREEERIIRPPEQTARARTEEACVCKKKVCDGKQKRGDQKPIQ